MGYLGDFAEDYATLSCRFNTRTLAGVPITLGGTPAISVYKQGGTTESTAGVVLTVDYDSRTGLHNVAIDLSADAFYEVGKDYDIVITTGTVDSVSVVGVVVGTFSISNRFVTAATLSTDAVTKIANGAAILNGTCQAGSSYNNIILAASGPSAVDDFYNDCLVTIVGGTGQGQARLIADYTGATKTAIVDDPWVTAPAVDSLYRIYPFSGILLADTGLAAAADSTHITLATSAPAIANTYIGHTVFISGGTGIGQARVITAYTNTRICTVRTWDTTPDTTSIYKILPVSRVYVNEMGPGVINNAAFAADVGTTAYATNPIAQAADKGVTNYDPSTNTEMAAYFAAVATAADVAALILADPTYKIVTDTLGRVPLDITDSQDVETGLTLLAMMRRTYAALCGKTDGMHLDTGHFRNQADTVNRITVVTDANNNRTGLAFIDT